MLNWVIYVNNRFGNIDGNKKGFEQSILLDLLILYFATLALFSYSMESGDLDFLSFFYFCFRCWLVDGYKDEKWANWDELIILFS